MQKRTDKKSFFMTVLLSACGKGENEEVPEKAFGLDYPQEQEFQSPVQVVCNADNGWIITTLKNDPIHKWSLQAAGTNKDQVGQQPEGGGMDIYREPAVGVKSKV